MKEANFYKKLDDSKVQCNLCPHHCVIRKNRFGKCNSRKNFSGNLYSMVYNKPISINVDPIEKKPLYHFMPGENVFSIGTTGCNFHCSFCQNSEISQCKPSKRSLTKSPEEIIEDAKNTNSKIIAYTYTEPTIFYEYMLDIAKLAKKENMFNVIVSNGFIEKDPLIKLHKYIDAANIDLKSINPKFYEKECDGRLEPVLESIKYLNDKIWLELTNLIIPSLNDSNEEIKKLSLWVKNNLGKDVPLHFSAFYPCYKRHSLPPASASKIKEARDIAINEGLNYVYTGNLPESETNSTYCPNCNNIILKRTRFSANINNIHEGKCKFCNYSIPGLWASKDKK